MAIKKLSFKNNTPVTSGISKINNAFIDNAEDLDIVMLMYNLLESSGKYSMTSGILRNLYYRDEINADASENANNNRINNNNSNNK